MRNGAIQHKLFAILFKLFNRVLFNKLHTLPVTHEWQQGANYFNLNRLKQINFGFDLKTIMRVLKLFTNYKKVHSPFHHNHKLKKKKKKLIENKNQHNNF